MLQGIKIRLYPNKVQEEYISKLLGSYRFVYNQCLDLKIKSYTNDKTNLGLKELGNYYHKNLTKNEEYDWLTEHNSKVLKQSIIDLLDSYKRFFVNGTGFPQFKSKHNNNQSARFPLESISKMNDYSSNRITLTKNIKNIKFKCSKKYKDILTEYKSNIKSGTLSKNKSGEYYFSVLIDSPLNKELPKSDKSIGIDLGIKDFIVTSDNTNFNNIKVKRNNQKKLSKLHRNLSRKKKGGKNRNKARIKLAKFHNKLNNKKEQYLHEVSNSLLNDNQIIIMENLNVKGMLKNHYLSKSIQELSLHRFKSILEYKSKWYNRDLVIIDRFYPSSKLCSCCGYKNNDLKLQDRTWECPDCNTIHDRDYNAATNILHEGLKLYKECIPTRCGKLTPLETSGYTVDELGNK
jgi:putative transposase